MRLMLATLPSERMELLGMAFTAVVALTWLVWLAGKDHQP